MNQKHEFFYRMIIILLTVILVFTLVQSPRSTNAAPLVAGAPMINVKVFNIMGAELLSASQVFTNISDLGIFTVHSESSIVELTFIGRIGIGQFLPGATAAIFELNLDNKRSTIGKASATVQKSEEGYDDVPVTITGYFSGLSVGDHIASIWVRGIGGSVNRPRLAATDGDTDVLIVKEYLPFGVSYLPMITK